ALRRERGDAPSVPPLKRAVEFDPDFPLPYATLAAIYGNLRQPTVAQAYAGKAHQLRGRVGERERLQIAGVYYLEMGDLDDEIRNYKLWQEKYPRDYLPRNNLGNDYAQIGKLEEALAEYQEALRLQPSVITYTNVVGMDLSLNRFDAAQVALDAAFAHGLDGRYLHQTQYWLSFVVGDTAKMDSQVAWAMGKPGDEDPLLSMKSDTEAYYGRVQRARGDTQRAVDSAVHAGSPEAAALWQVNGALREAEWGDAAVARDGVAKALALSQGRDVKLMAAFTLARSGKANGAETLVHELKRDYPTDSLLKLYWLPCIAAAVALDAGDAKQTLADLEPTRPYELGAAATFINYVYPAYLRGQAYLLAHDGAAAAMEFRKLPEHIGLVTNFVTGALARLELGRAYAMAGDTAKAKAAYRDFFSLWKEADHNIPVLQQARAEYANLP
ncbi:MAG TPA: tetratricopeptide repeat protein, partial [Gammaproteobacteria bacterium]|nr:tetratricopeptide repeat protein [Gammaproteobacteria bacterium]